MKLTILNNFWIVFLAFIAPLQPLMLIITIMVIFDTFVGRWYAKKKGELITSKITRKGITMKLMIYLSVIILVYLIDRNIVNEITKKYIWFDYLFTKFWTGLFVWIEYTSIDEKIRWIKGEGISEKIKRFIKSIKDTVFSFTEVKKQLKD
jgi:hypothetical protein